MKDLKSDFEYSVGPRRSLKALRDAARLCTACPLYKNATQTVFGEGRRHAEIVLVGEQPGDREDQEGRPFIGPAGMLLNRALQEAGINRNDLYLTNVVKHFKFEPRGKRRIHKKPSAREMGVCMAWLEAELRIIHPEIVVCLGATAAQALLGKEVRVMHDRGKFLKSPFCDETFVTVHPSSLLRAPDARRREENYRLFVRDLKLVSKRQAAG